TITQLLTSRYIFLITLHIFPCTRASHNLFHKPSLQTLSYAFFTSINAQYVDFPSIFLPRTTSEYVYNTSTHPLPLLNPPCSSTNSCSPEMALIFHSIF